MTALVKVVYTKLGRNTSSTMLGKIRWLGEDGRLFSDEAGTDKCNSGFTHHIAGSTEYEDDCGARVALVQEPLTLDPIKPAQPATTYADGNPKAIQGAKKYSLRLLPLPAAIVVNQALEDGVAKYGAANWRETGVAASVYIDACERHIKQWYDGSQELALDSMIHNLGHAMACLAIIVDAQHNGKLIDDRPMPCKDTDSLLLRKVTA